MDDLKFCSRPPRAGDLLNGKCTECPHVIGLHSDEGCPLCVLAAGAEAMGTVVMQFSERFTPEVAASLTPVLTAFAVQFAALAPALEHALKRDADGRG